MKLRNRLLRWMRLILVMVGLPSSASCIPRRWRRIVAEAAGDKLQVLCVWQPAEYRGT